MAIAFDGSDGLFTRWGKLGFAMEVVDEFRGKSGSAIAEDLPGLIADCMAEYDGGAIGIRELVANLPAAQASAAKGLQAIQAALREVARKTLVKMINDDDPQPSLTENDALAELYRQMVAGTEDILGNTVGVTPAAGGSNVGTGVLVASVKDGRGYDLQYVLAEDIEFTVSSTGTAGSEQWTGRGEAAVGEKLSHLWPGGSGSSVTHTSRTAADSENRLDDEEGTFETFTVTDLPDGWVAAVGTVTTHFGEDAVNFYKGTSALAFKGNGSTLTSLTYELDTSRLAAKTPYAVNLWQRVSATAAAGVGVIDLIDGSDNVIADEAGNNNTKTVDLTALTTSWEACNVVFRLPDPIPSTVKLRIRQTTALTNTKNWIIDELAMIPMTRQYSSGGPYFQFFSGATNWSGDDIYTAAVANNYAAKFGTWLMRVLDIEGTGVILPVDGTPSIAEALFA